MGVRSGSCVIASGETSSPWQRADFISTLAVQAPQILDAETFKIEVTVDGVNPADLEDGEFAGAGDIRGASAFPYTAFRITSTGAVAADREFVFSSDQY